jgi:NAD(P)-dependent dehydrogenase (short-subunit alcohol dehydrogenase family)
METPHKAIITGGGTGIGKATAKALTKAGWHVVICGRTRSVLDDVCAELSTDLVSGKGAIHAIVADVCNELSVKTLFEKSIDLMGRVDLLFNNAGVVLADTAVTELGFDDWSKLMDVNVNGAFLCAREAFRCMSLQSPKGGRIINNGSISAHVPRPEFAAYTVSKHAMTGLTKALSLEGRQHSIACGQIDIGNAETGLIDAGSAGCTQADGSIRQEPTMNVSNVASSVLHMANLPLDANVQFMTVMATNMPYIGRG